MSGNVQGCLRSWLVALLLLAAGSSFAAEEAEWIWSKDHKKDAVPANATCHFRRTFTLKAPESASVTIAADVAYELYVNGQKMGSGAGTKKLVEHDISKSLARGLNVVAIKVTN